MDNVTVACSCGRTMTAVGNAPKGTFRCGCGTTVMVTLTERLRCGFIADGRNVCRWPPGKVMAELGIALCTEHQETLAAKFEEVRHEARSTLTMQEQIALHAAHYAELDEGLRRRDSEEEERRLEESVVYYLRFGDRIKIGWSTSFHGRVRDLMPDQILATEPGGAKLEHQRHKQFASLRHPGLGERFTRTDELMAHIAQIRQLHGEPHVGGELRHLIAPESDLRSGDAAHVGDT